MITKLSARDVMNDRVLMVNEDMALRELAGFLIEHDISGAPVRDSDGLLVGVVSSSDVVRASSSADGMAVDRSDPGFYIRGWEDKLDESELRNFKLEESEVLVKDIMTRAVFSVDLETGVPDVARAMLDGKIHRVLVTNGDEVAGIISTSDLLQAIATPKVEVVTA